KSGNFEYRFLRATCLPRLQSIDAKERAAIGLVPGVKHKLVKAGAPTAPAYLSGAAAVAVLGETAKIDAAGAGGGKVGDKVGGLHGKYPKSRRARLSTRPLGIHAAFPLRSSGRSSLRLSAKDCGLPSAPVQPTTCITGKKIFPYSRCL